MPQLNPLDWGPQLIWLLITFGILYLLMVYVALPRIGSVIEARAARIAKDLAQADKLRRQTEEAIAALSVASRSNAGSHGTWPKLDAELAKRGAEAEARINAAKTSAMREVNSVAADVAADIVRQLIGIAPSRPEIEKAVETARKD